MRHLLSRKIAVFAIFAIAMAMGSLAHSQSITVDAGQPNAETLGFPTNYTFNGINPDYPSEIKWEFRQNDGFGVSAWFTASCITANFGSPYYSIPIGYDIRCTVTYLPGPGWPCPPAAAVVVRHVAIAPPDDVSASNAFIAIAYNPSTTLPTTTSVAGTQGYYLKFPLKVSGKDIGPYIGFTAQENIIDCYVGGVLQPNPGANPFPPTNNNVLFQILQEPCMNSYFIGDWKVVTLPPGYTTAPVGELSTYTQEIMITFTDLCNNVQTISLGSCNYATTGVTTTTWEVQILD